MADDLAEKVFNVICNTGGFVELSSLLTDSSPLKHIKSKLEAKNWLIQHAGGRFVVVKDINDEVIGVRVELKKKICKHYLERGSCKVAKGKCRFWHICKSHLEGDCYGKCRHNRSHDFYDNDNEQKTKDLKIAKHPNGRLKNLVAWSLPQVCLLYLRNDCISDKCPYLHVCSNVVRELPCTSCGLSHSLTDFHNKNILKQYDLVPHKGMKTTFVCTSILVMKEQRSFTGEKHRSQNALASPANKLSDSATLSNATEDCPQRGTTGQESSSCGANDCHVNSNSEEISGGTDIDAKKNETKPDQPKSKKQQIQKNIPKYVNDLASSVTASASSKKNPGFLNIEEEEEEGHSDSSSEDNKSEWKSFLSAKGSQSIHQTFESKPSNKLVDNDPKFLEAKAVSKEDPKVDPCTSKGAAKAGTIRNDPPVLPAYSFENDFVKKWLLGVDDCSSDSTQSLEHPQTKDKPVRRKRKSSISSSCSSAPDPQKCTPFKKAVFDCILKEYNGTVPFRIISKRKDLFTEGCGDIATWFKARKESFLLKQSKDGTIIEISAYCRRVQFCFNQEHCSKKECSFLHACRNYIAGFCRFGSGCQRNHTFKNDENRKFISKLKLTGLSEEQLRKVVQLSIPQVCLDYNEGCCVLGESCGKIHICKDMIRKRCADQGICGLEHEEALLTAQATAILNRYGLKIKDGHVHSVVRTLLVCERKHSVDLNLTVKETISTATSMTSSNSAVESKGEKKQSGSSPFSLTSVSVAKTTSTVSTTSPSTMTKGATGSKNSSYQRSGPSPLIGIATCYPSDHIDNVIVSIRKEIFPSGNSGEPSERKVFECLCKEYNCSVTFSVISKRTDLFPAGFKDVESWFRKRKGSFLILENPDGKITEVSAFAAKARLCFSYNNAHYGTCAKDNCSFLHICRDYITDSCANGATCPRNHQFCNEKDKALLSQINLEKFTDEQLRRLVLSSSPLICVEYNDGICDRGDACPRIHMCSNHLKKCSREGRGCLLEHESAMTTDHTRAILERFRIDHLKPGAVKKAILLFDDLAQSRETGHVHSDKPDAPICSDFLLGKCKKGMKCSGHHCSLPYHWQYRVEGEGVWKSFTETDNEKVEKLYCDAMMDDCSATGFQLSFER
ncbi:uncharacterized protein LOC111332135 [Stylophora pistillata]|uniref:uncharacterized protein LOC111332135 n=1 Tax=Stylophora pistillata TaxID=50429 RepID=UPI000C052DB9|nr:uncharacterized protein LOC111332135 [Stylophora pistillata]